MPEEREWCFDCDYDPAADALLRKIMAMTPEQQRVAREAMGMHVREHAQEWQANIDRNEKFMHRLRNQK